VYVIENVRTAAAAFKFEDRTWQHATRDEGLSKEISRYRERIVNEWNSFETWQSDNWVSRLTMSAMFSSSSSGRFRMYESGILFSSWAHQRCSRVICPRYETSRTWCVGVSNILAYCHPTLSRCGNHELLTAVSWTDRRHLNEPGWPNDRIIRSYRWAGRHKRVWRRLLWKWDC